MSCLLTSRIISAATVRVLYRHVTLPHSLVFSKFLRRITQLPELGAMVRRFDLSHFTSLGMGRTKQSNQEIQNFTARTLRDCLAGMPRVQEVLLQEHVDQDVDTDVLRKLFYDLPQLEALDVCASSIASFKQAFTDALAPLKDDRSLSIRLQRICLHECYTLPSADLTLLLGRLPNLTVLDLYHTRVTDASLASIPDSARLSHLNIGRCPSLTASGVLNFLMQHSATKNLVWLNLSCDPSRFRLLDDIDVDALLPALPSSLRSLNLNRAKIKPRHLPILTPLTKHLEELGLGYSDLSLGDIATFFSSDASCILEPENNTLPCTLHYLDLTGLSTCTQPQLVKYSSQLLSEGSLPLEVIEVSSKVGATLQKSRGTNADLGWTPKELGRRSWYVRTLGMGRAEGAETGKRDWKMGSTWWGMRKAPVAKGDVGGLYGHYMFKI